MSRQLDPNRTYIFDGTVRIGARAYFGLPNTDPRVVANRIPIFSNKAGTVEIPQPQQTDEQGVLPNIYVNAQEYSFAVDTAPEENSEQIVYEPALEGFNSPGLITSDIDMNGFKHVNVANATANNQYLTLGQAYQKMPQAVVVDVLSTRNAIVANLPVNPDALLFGQPIRTYLTHDENDSSGVTVKLGAFDAKQTYKGNNLPLDIGDTWGNGAFCDWLYDSTLDKYQLLNPAKVNKAINSDTLDEQDPSFYLDRANMTGTQLLNTISDAGLFAAWNAFNGNASGNEGFLIDLPVSSGSPTNYLRVQGDRRTSNTDAAQSFSFILPFAAVPIVLLQRIGANEAEIYPVTTVSPTGFTVNRIDTAFGGDFYYVAFGRHEI